MQQQKETILTTHATIPCIIGPTASGKSKLAMDLTEKFPSEIVSVDSALIYKGMDIGTAKPNEKELKKIRHYFINICDPKVFYSAADFISEVVPIVKSVLANNKLPILVGGTMMYFRALQQGLSPLPGADPEVRKDILRQAETHGWEFIHQLLQKVDPIAAERIHPNDPQRLQRALEVYRITGHPMSTLQQTPSVDIPQWNYLNIALMVNDRQQLHQRIAERFEQMLQQGFVNEVNTLYRRGDLSLDLPSMRAVGYRQVWEYLEGKMTYEQMVEKAKTATRQLAKRQITWLRSWPEASYFDFDDPALVEKVTKKIQLTL